MNQKHWPPTVRQVFWGTIVLIIILSIFVLIVRPYGVTLWTWLDIVVLPAAVVFLAFVLNEAVTKRERVRDDENAEKDHRRDRTYAENEYRKDFLTRIMRAYNGAKKVRRVLKAHKSNEKIEKIPCTVYEAQVEALMDSQLELELYKPDEVTKQPNALLPAFENEKKKEISERLSKLEEYLNGIIKEYDGGDYAKVKEKLGINGPSSQIHLQELEKLEKFIDIASFKKDFSTPVRSLAGDVKNEIERALERENSNGSK